MINRRCAKCGREFMGYADDCGCQGNIPIAINSNTSKTIETSWFKRHLNLTWLFVALLVILIAASLKTFLGATIFDGKGATYFLIWCTLPLNAWILKQKGRSLHWLWLSFVFFPYIVLILKNKKVIQKDERCLENKQKNSEVWK